MADMFDMPLDSSPLKEPSPRGETPPATATQSPHESPSPPQTLVLPRRKRPAEDLTQFAGEVSRAHKLKKEDHDTLIGFSALERGEQLVSLAGQLLAIAHHQNLIQPAPKEWKVPKKLVDKINSKAASLVADPSIPAYRDAKIGPSKLLIDMIYANPKWGFGAELKDEKHATDSLASVVSMALAGRRNMVKNTILGSLGSDPEEGAATALRPGATNIVDLTAAVLVKLKVKSTQVDVRMCGRIAMLRQLISENDDNKYWGNVDENLASVRAKYPDPVMQSRFIKRYILDLDFQTYGAVDLTSLATPSVPITGPSTALHAAAVATASGNDSSS
ncbi:hypothetical protein DFH08DRAFT_802126 [Mycena albidolilacea]|uniref:Uncharacterized protein n=1 Tax=Mycena albidolilacea TaxID=1033008 RepID=A0AAD7AGP6_9AGAR|nr:hypothetical protein DFH08DRAFT_802126 [Mycena albidolilacea]